MAYTKVWDGIVRGVPGLADQFDFKFSQSAGESAAAPLGANMAAGVVVWAESGSGASDVCAAGFSVEARNY